MKNLYKFTVSAVTVTGEKRHNGLNYKGEVLGKSFFSGSSYASHVPCHIIEKFGVEIEADVAVTLSYSTHLVSKLINIVVLPAELEVSVLE